MANLLSSISLTLFEAFKVKEFILTGVSEWKEFSGGNPTNKLLGYKYTVVTPKTFDKITIKVGDLSNPVIIQEEINNSTQQILVSFTGDELRFYRSNSGEYLPTIKADKISIINKTIKG